MTSRDIAARVSYRAQDRLLCRIAQPDDGRSVWVVVVTGALLAAVCIAARWLQ